MKKFIIFFMLVFLVVVITSFNNPNLSEADIIQDQIEDFEKGEHHYYPPTLGDPQNRVAKMGSGIINKIVDSCFELINKIVS